MKDLSPRLRRRVRARSVSTLLLTTAIAFAAGCGSGSGDTPPVDATSPTVSALVVPNNAAGAVPLLVTITDPESDSVALEVSVSTDGGATWRAASVETTGTSANFELTALPTSPGGTTHELEWNTLPDLGFRALATAPQLRATVTSESVGESSGSATAAVHQPTDNFALAAQSVESHMTHYGPFDAATMAIAKRHDLVVLHTSSGSVTTDQVRELQAGRDPEDPSDDVLVLAYISIGEDLRTTNLTDSQMLADSRFVGDGTGPRVDPRGPNADGGALSGLDPLGSASPGGSGYASWYLDDNSVDQGAADGLPDRNTNFGGAFVNAGDPAWFTALDAMSADGVDGVSGMRELLTDSFGRGYACDGLFLDTVDTCAPNSFTDSSSGNQSEFEWTAHGFFDFIARLDTAYPDKLILQNRGLFLFDPRFPHYAANPRTSLDYVLVESYRLDSDESQGFDEYFFADNKHNFAPKLMAEASRPDGFRVLSLGYAAGPGIELETLTGGSSAGLSSLQIDVLETQLLAGFRHYMTDGGLTFANSFVLDIGLPSDTTAPVWSSTYNTNIFAFPTPAEAPTPREGIQEVTAGQACATVRWDIALDQSQVGYAVYVSSDGFDFVADPDLATAMRTVLEPSIPSAYSAGPGPGVFPFEATIDGLTPGTTYSFCIRAFDSEGNEDTNQIVLQATPLPLITITIDGVFADWATVPTTHVDPDDAADSSGPDWLDFRIGNDADNLYLRFSSANPFNFDGSPGFAFSRTLIFLDVDNNASTGWSVGSSDPIGSDLLINGTGLFSQSSSNFNTGVVRATLAIEPQTNVLDCELAIPLSDLEAIAPSLTSPIRIRFLNDETNDFAPDAAAITYGIVR